MNVPTLAAAIGLAALVSACAAPGPAREPSAPPDWKAGEAWNYQQFSAFTGHLYPAVSYSVVAAGDPVLLRRSEGDTSKELRVSKGWTPLRRVLPDGRVIEYNADVELLRFPLPGDRSWTSNGTATDVHTGQRLKVQVQSYVKNWESVTTPAGTFEAVRIERATYVDDADWWRSQTRINETDWYAPSAKAVVKSVYDSGYMDLMRDRGGLWQKGDRVLGQLAPR